LEFKKLKKSKTGPISKNLISLSSIYKKYCSSIFFFFFKESTSQEEDKKHLQISYKIIPNKGFNVIFDKRIF